MSLTVNITGLTEALADLRATASEIDKACVKAVNEAASEIRRKLLVSAMSARTGIDPKLLTQRIYIRRATAGRAEASIAPSSAGIEVTNYDWHYTPVPGSVTRAQIKVKWITGIKIAAGFVNPHGKQKLPLRTRTDGGKPYRPHEALGPSAAAQFKALVDSGVRQSAQDILRRQFDKALRNLK